MKVSLGKFAKSGIEDRLGPDLPAGALVALTHYMRRLKSEFAPIAPPAFLRRQPEDGGDPFELTLKAETEAALEREAARHQVPVDQMLAHAVLIYLADMDEAQPLADPAASLEAARL